MNFLSNNKWPQEGISYTFQIPPNISIGRLKNHKMNWILVIFYHTSYAGAGCHRHNSVTIKNIIFSKIFYCLEIVSRFSQTMQSSGGWKLVRSQLLSRDIFPQTIKQHCICCENHKRHSIRDIETTSIHTFPRRGLFIIWRSNYCTILDKWSMFWTSCYSETLCWVSICLSIYLNG